MITEIDFKVTGEERKKLAYAIGEMLELPVKYTRTPRFDWSAYPQWSGYHLANKAGRGWRKNVLISEKVYENISKDVQDYFSKCQIDSKTYYESDILWIEYEDWIEQNCN